MGWNWFKRLRSWQDSNLQSSDPKSDALSIRPHDLLYIVKLKCQFESNLWWNTILQKYFFLNLPIESKVMEGACGRSSKASEIGSDDCRFESCPWFWMTIKKNSRLLLWKEIVLSCMIALKNRASLSVFGINASFEFHQNWYLIAL